MKQRWVAGLAAVLLVLMLYGCGGDSDDGPPPLFATDIYSDPSADGDIAFTPPSTFTVTSAYTAGNLFAGIDPVNGDEFRGFLDFPLGGSAGVPLGAAIQSASLEIFINSVTVPSVSATVPIVMELVDFQPPDLIASDFDRMPLLSLSPFDFFTSDVSKIVAIDVTPLMQEAQRLGLPDLQIRLMLDFSAASGFIEIDDDIGNDATAPLLRVTYF